MGHPLNVLFVSGAAQGGGAERMAWSLHQAIKTSGHKSWLAVGRRNVEDPAVLQIPESVSVWSQVVGAAVNGLAPFAGKVRGAGRAQALLRRARTPNKLFDWYRGREHFDYPGTADLIALPPKRPDIIHCHNLHGDYFDLRELSNISRLVPVVMTLHDEWTYTGHCAYTMGCERWETGCGSCPGLNIHPAVRRDATAENWRQKRAIYANSRLYISTPSHWLMQRAHRSVLSQAAADEKVIYNGVDLDLFAPGDKRAARARLGLPQDIPMLLFTANGAKHNMFKDYETVRAAAHRVSADLPDRALLLIALGDRGQTERIGRAELRLVPYERDPVRVASYYQAADLYLHAAKADNLPTTILEALACGVPVVATATGGIPEQVKCLAGIPGCWDGQTHGPDKATGVLVPPGDASSMAAAAGAILRDGTVRRRMAENARLDATLRFDLRHQVTETLNWYSKILNSTRSNREDSNQQADR